MSRVEPTPHVVPKRCTPAVAATLSPPETDLLATRLKALADPTRLRLIALLAARAGAEVCVCDLVCGVELTQPTVSHHLKVLVDAGLLTREKRGVWAYYAIVSDAFAALTSAITLLAGSGAAHPSDHPRKPSVLFVCIHNAGRSQMAAGFAHALGGDAVIVDSAGSAPGKAVNPVAVAAMAEREIDISAARPQRLTDAAVRAADVIVTMGCGDACPVFPGKRYEDWQLADPAGHGLEVVRPIRDEIERRVRELLQELGIPQCDVGNARA